MAQKLPKIKKKGQAIGFNWLGKSLNFLDKNTKGSLLAPFFLKVIFRFLLPMH